LVVGAAAVPQDDVLVQFPLEKAMNPFKRIMNTQM
jgi:hypothetical protein